MGKKITFELPTSWGCWLELLNPIQRLKQELSADYPNVAIHSSLDDAGALNYDAYSVVVPAEHHYSVAKTLIEHKKHVLIEKPITTNSKESNELVALAKAKQRGGVCGSFIAVPQCIFKNESTH